VRIKTGQRMYRVRSPDGWWLQKVSNSELCWTEHENEGLVFKKLSHLRKALRQGALVSEKLEQFLDGLPTEAVKVIEYQVTFERTGRKSRLTELENFTREEYVP